MFIDNSNFIENFTNQGGAIYYQITQNNDNNVFINNSKFIENSVSTYGGAI
ncbi:hypothetical protein ALNOE001_19730 [Candidatus Methanobinarius endosymbioticus]|uniref:Uncharacterized protein n=1 Tax=Candidatus Methanobinarius endosymbioticus TaxID=2006182 RepID=A0A366M9N2_9EURY|nr:hypothetical protein ALNOE001_19730 [Candidatus Methanobinarius endosymbioticus]